MNFCNCFSQCNSILMEGAIGERLKREYNITFHESVAMASLVYSESSKYAMKNIFNDYIDIAKSHNLPLMITTPTRRANYERVKNSEYDKNIIIDNVKFLKSLAPKNNNIFIGGLMGCKGDAYKAVDTLGIEESFNFHSWQAKLFRQAEVDFLYAAIMPGLTEAIGMAKAMEKTKLPYIISFMITKEGTLIDGTTIHDAITSIDENTHFNPICYMTNCVHPNTLASALNKDFNKTPTVIKRFMGIQANAADLPSEQLDGSIELISDDSLKLSSAMNKLYSLMNVKIFGGCCGTNKSHMKEIAKIMK